MLWIGNLQLDGGSKAVFGQKVSSLATSTFKAAVKNEGGKLDTGKLAYSFTHTQQLGGNSGYT